MSDESGDLEFVGAAMDVTAAKETEQRLKCSEAYLHEAQRLAHMGSSVRNASSGDFIASPEFQRIFGFDPDKEKPTFEMFRDRIHPDDILGVVGIVNKARSEKRDYEADFRIVLPDGSIRHCHSVAYPVFDGSGEVAEYFTTILDVTERKQAAEVLQRSQNTFRAMVEKSAEGILLMRPDRASSTPARRWNGCSVIRRRSSPSARWRTSPIRTMRCIRSIAGRSCCGSRTTCRPPR